MGNRAVVTNKNQEVGIYLHWNGGPESVCAFLTYAKAIGVRGPEYDESYFFARLGQICSNFLGGTLSCGMGLVKKMDANNGDNGTYVVDANFNVAQRLYSGSDSRECVKESWMRGFLLEIDKRMGEHARMEDATVLETVEFAKVPGLEIKKGE